MTPAGTFIDVQNEWEENTHTQHIKIVLEGVLLRTKRVLIVQRDSHVSAKGPDRHHNGHGAVCGPPFDTVTVDCILFTKSFCSCCQFGTWSQRGTKINGSHHGDNPLLRPTGIQIATKSYATLQSTTPTNNKTVHQTSFTPYREQPRTTRIVVAYPRPAFSATNRTDAFQPVLINNSKFLKATHRTKIR